IKYILDLAVHTAISERPGPVLLDIPTNIQKIDIDPDGLEGYQPKPPSYDLALVKEQIDQFIADYKKAERPVILIGGGIWSARAAYLARELGAWLKAPCLPTWNAIDIFTSDYEYYRGRVGTFGGPGRNFAIQNSDLLLAIGTRISGRITGGYVESFARVAKKYIVDVDMALLYPHLQQVRGDVNI
ncbi:unnamed protein product, partial [marine sediment metagenome]